MTAPSTLRAQVIAAGEGWCQATHSHDNSKAAIAAATTALRAAKERIREQCGMCDGHGYTIEVVSGSRAEHHPECDGSCRDCPVEVETQEQAQEACEYCGRPMDQIDALLRELEGQ